MSVFGLQKSTWKLCAILSKEKFSFMNVMFNKQIHFICFFNKENIAVI